MPDRMLPAPDDSSPQTAAVEPASEASIGPFPAPPIPEALGVETPPEPTLPATPPPASAPGPRAKRAYQLRKPFQSTPARRAAARANLAKAREILKGRGWPHSERQRAAARENIQKAQATIRARGLPSTAARQRAAMINLAKANAVLRERGYRRNQKQIAAARANLRKAWEVSHAPDLISYACCHAHRLTHGLSARRLEQLLVEYGDILREILRVKGEE